MTNPAASAELAKLQAEAIDLVAQITQALNKGTPNAHWGHVGDAKELVKVLRGALHWAQ